MCFNIKDKFLLKRDCSVFIFLLFIIYKLYVFVNMMFGYLKYGLKDFIYIFVYVVFYKESDRNGLYLNFLFVGIRSCFICIMRLICVM